MNNMLFPVTDRNLLNEQFECLYTELWDKIQRGDRSIRGRAKAITRKQQEFYEEGRLGMIIDGTGRRHKKIQRQKNHAESLGYDTFMVFVNTTLNVALERNRVRERVLADEAVTQMWEDTQENLGAVQRMFGNQNFVIIDNTEFGPPTQEVQKAVNEFVRRPIENPIGQQWVENAKKLKRLDIV